MYSPCPINKFFKHWKDIDEKHILEGTLAIENEAMERKIEKKRTEISKFKKKIVVPGVSHRIYFIFK